MKAKPVRLQLSRRKGFNLQRLSHETNGLPAVNVARPSKWGNPFVLYNEEGSPLAEDSRTGTLLGTNLTWPQAQQLVVDRYRVECTDALPLSQLAGKNLACFCRADEPCHADVLLELANASDGDAT